MTMDDGRLRYEVYVDDNYHYMDEDERYSGGVFDSWEAAEAKPTYCRRVPAGQLQGRHGSRRVAQGLQIIWRRSVDLTAG